MEKQATSKRAGTLGSRTVFSQETFEFLRTEVRQNILVIEDESRSITLTGGFDHLVICGAAAFDIDEFILIAARVEPFLRHDAPRAPDFYVEFEIGHANKSGDASRRAAGLQKESEHMKDATVRAFAR